MAMAEPTGKRVRKSIDIFVPPDSIRKEKDCHILPGIGTKLEDIPNVVSNFDEITWSNPHLKMLHDIVFGRGKKKEFKSKLLQFSGLIYMVKKGKVVDDNKEEDNFEDDLKKGGNDNNEDDEDDYEGIEEDTKEGQGERIDTKKEDEGEKVEEKKMEEKKHKGDGDKEGEEEQKCEEKGDSSDNNDEDHKELATTEDKKGGKNEEKNESVDQDDDDDRSFTESEREKMILKIEKLGMTDIKAVMDLVDVERDSQSFDIKKAPTKNMLSDRLLEWLEKPEESGRNKRKMKQLKGATKGGRKSSSGTKKRKSISPKKRSTKEKKKSGRKKTSKNNLYSGDEETEDEETEAEEENDERPIKKRKSSFIKKSSIKEKKKRGRKKTSKVNVDAGNEDMEVKESEAEVEDEEDSPTKKLKFNIPGCTIEQVRKKVKEIVDKGDKNELSVRSVRLSLEEWLDADLKQSKDIIRSIVMDAMN